MSNKLYKYLFIICLIFLTASSIVFAYIFGSLLSENTNETAYFNALICSNSLLNDTPQIINIKKKNIPSPCAVTIIKLRHTIIRTLQDGSYIKNISKEQKNHIDILITKFLLKHTNEIINGENEEIVTLTETWIKKDVPESDEKKLNDFYMKNDRTTELLQIISDYLGVKAA